ncbi:UvrD-helicase domain-containing protein [Amycolatopsis rubida]|uniref:UvrD-like helicase C-terminal domain-containing protein n=1 Tax=Amycolatopsis rubida TaxID=112413 RepID=A0A1I5W8Z3_9PSEU|nr:UvrD-helicase domain-containing protein [Amycolatopsis rubida]SFQ16195.1 UvrD-like helicase C-terminal domain-containing protein [Amycolatopsis rubida]
MTTEESISLTASQQAVVDLPWHTKVLVNAAAGTGKTTTLVRRIEHLVQEEELQVADILVLSFSRAAVRELSERLVQAGTVARRVRAQTFDSWATSVLYQEDPQRTDLSSVSYDQRIKMAAEVVERGVVEESERGEPQHVVVDEIQDLVGVRRDLVEAVLDRFRHSGFTVVGDVAQSIYSFQVSDPVARAGETGRFFDWLRASFPDELVEHTLDVNFRARTPEARAALGLGPRLQRMRTDADAVDLLRELSSLLSGVPSFGSLEDRFVQDSLREAEGTTAILCQDNAQVLALSAELDKHSISHQVKRGAHDRAAPPWLAALLEVVFDGKITEREFRDATERFEKTVSQPPAFAWRSLRRVAHAPGNRLDLFALRRAIVEERLPDDLTALVAHRLTVSTVHRVKGMEFDRVLFVEGSRVLRDVDDVQAAARLQYVAMTRPRLDLYRLDTPKTWMYRKANLLPSRAERWYLSYQKAQCNGIEVLDFDAVPARSSDSIEVEPAAIQKYLREQVSCGDLMEFRKLHDLPMAVDETPEYGLFHDGVRVGEASQQFRRDLRRLIGGRERDVWPISIEGMRVDAMHTTARRAGANAQPRLAEGDIWLMPRLGGIGRIIWCARVETREGTIQQ